MMTNFSPISAAIGGSLIGLSSVLLMFFIGRIVGISGIFDGVLNVRSGDNGWRIAFVLGLVLTPLLAALFGHGMRTPQMPASWTVIVAGGLLVGFGTRLANGCTSGHGICGIARLSSRSITATIVFMVFAITTVALTRHVFGS